MIIVEGDFVMKQNHCLEDNLHKRKTAVVIGADSSIGQELVSELLLKYTSIILTENPKYYIELERKVEEIRKVYPKHSIMLLELDIRNRKDLEKFEQLIEEETYIVDSVFYLAGINILIPALEVTKDIWKNIFEINLEGFFLIAQCVAKNMIKNEGGSILGISSQHGVIVNYDRAPYCASKAGMIHLAKELALEWAKYGIRVNTISPTMILSEKNKDILESEQGKKKYLKKIPLRKYAAPKDVSDAAIFLNSEKAQMITGQNLVIDGGWSLS